MVIFTDYPIMSLPIINSVIYFLLVTRVDNKSSPVMTCVGPHLGFALLKRRNDSAIRFLLFYQLCVGLEANLTIILLLSDLPSRVTK